MVRTIGYGEDALTYHVMTKRLAEVLGKLQDDSDESSCVLFYRPSFGRGGRSRSLIGECDAILVTPRCMYLIESKWSGSKELRTGELAPCQDRRHEMIAWIAGHWNDRQELEDFCQSNQKAFGEEFVGRELPKADSGVFSRLAFVISTARNISCDGAIRTMNILLVIMNNGDYKKIIKPNNFEIVQVDYEPIGSSKYFLM